MGVSKKLSLWNRRSPISNGTVTKTVTVTIAEEGKSAEVVETLERAMGFEPTTTSLGS